MLLRPSGLYSFETSIHSNLVTRTLRPPQIHRRGVTIEIIWRHVPECDAGRRALFLPPSVLPLSSSPVKGFHSPLHLLDITRNRPSERAGGGGLRPTGRPRPRENGFALTTGATTSSLVAGRTDVRHCLFVFFCSLPCQNSKRRRERPRVAMHAGSRTRASLGETLEDQRAKRRRSPSIQSVFQMTVWQLIHI